MVRLGDICSVRSGYAFKSDEFVSNEVPVIRIGNVTVDGLVIDNNICFDNDFWESNPNYRVNLNDLLIAMSGATVGKSCQNTNSYKLLLNQRVAAISSDNHITLRYIYHAINSSRFMDYVLINSAGCAQPNISIKQLSNFSVPNKTEYEQKKIVDILDNLDKLICLRKQQICKFGELVKSRFIEMFGDPVANPMSWEKKALKLNVTLLNGRAYKQDELLDNGKYPVLRVGNFFSNRGWYYSDLELDEDKYCDNGDLLYAWSASFGPKIWNGGKVIYHYHIWKMLVGTAYSKQFLCRLLEYSTASFLGDSHGIAMMHLTKNGMEEAMFIVPPIDLQNEFATFVEQTEKLKLEVKESLEKLETLKKSLMQKYFG